MCLLYICADAICNESILQCPWILFTYLVLDEINDMYMYMYMYMYIYSTYNYRTVLRVSVVVVLIP
jgi:hypothetical protein